MQLAARFASDKRLLSLARDFDSLRPIGRSLNPTSGFNDNDSHSPNGVVLHPFAIPVLRARLNVARAIGRANAQLILTRLGCIPHMAP